MNRHDAWRANLREHGEPERGIYFGRGPRRPNGDGVLVHITREARAIRLRDTDGNSIEAFGDTSKFWLIPTPGDPAPTAGPAIPAAQALARGAIAALAEQAASSKTGLTAIEELDARTAELATSYRLTGQAISEADVTPVPVRRTWADAGNPGLFFYYERGIQPGRPILATTTDGSRIYDVRTDQLIAHFASPVKMWIAAAPAPIAPAPSRWSLSSMEFMRVPCRGPLTDLTHLPWPIRLPGGHSAPPRFRDPLQKSRSYWCNLHAPWVIRESQARPRPAARGGGRRGQRIDRARRRARAGHVVTLGRRRAAQVSEADEKSFFADTLAEYQWARDVSGLAPGTLDQLVKPVIEVCQHYGTMPWRLTSRQVDSTSPAPASAAVRRCARNSTGSTATWRSWSSDTGEVFRRFGVGVESPVDPFHRPRHRDDYGLRVPPSRRQTAEFFANWRDTLSAARKHAVACRA